MKVKLAAFGPTFEERAAQDNLRGVLEKAAPLGARITEIIPPPEPHPDAKWYDRDGESYLQISWDRPLDIAEFDGIFGAHLRGLHISVELQEGSDVFQPLGYYSRGALSSVLGSLIERVETDMQLPGAPRFTEYLKSRAAGKWTMKIPAQPPPGLFGCNDVDERIVKLDGVRLGNYSTFAHREDGSYGRSYVGVVPCYVDPKTAEIVRTHPNCRRRVDEVSLLYTDRYFRHGELVRMGHFTRMDDYHGREFCHDIPFP